MLSLNVINYYIDLLKSCKEVFMDFLICYVVSCVFLPIFERKEQGKHQEGIRGGQSQPFSFIHYCFILNVLHIFLIIKIYTLATRALSLKPHDQNFPTELRRNSNKALDLLNELSKCMPLQNKT